MEMRERYGKERGEMEESVEEGKNKRRAVGPSILKRQQIPGSGHLIRLWPSVVIFSTDH